jgi:serine/threonine protein kinase
MMAALDITPKTMPQYLRSLYGCVMNGLEYLHANEIIHHDFKPANILLRGRGFGCKGGAFISDFGLSRDFSELSNSKGSGRMHLTNPTCFQSTNEQQTGKMGPEDTSPRKSRPAFFEDRRQIYTLRASPSLRSRHIFQGTGLTISMIFSPDALASPMFFGNMSPTLFLSRILHSGAS